ncbi:MULTISPECIES: hypothetical protein [unclassified Caballeronia]|jgi:hypothetical protein|uniref:hypothetical protein n=1 Tax=unclassified Caballeronia TaxID=2646786 RepID=UPI0007723766|nr:MULTISPECIES: hypothetical protein [unclassified Caballeronia]
MISPFVSLVDFAQLLLRSFLHYKTGPHSQRLGYDIERLPVATRARGLKRRAGMTAASRRMRLTVLRETGERNKLRPVGRAEKPRRLEYDLPHGG